MLRKNIVFCILIGTNFTVIGHSTYMHSYEKIFSQKTSITVMKKEIKAIIEQNGHSANIQDQSGRTLLLYAIETKEPELVSFLIKECHANVTQSGVMKSTLNNEDEVVLPIEFAKIQLELSKTKDDHDKLKKILHYLKNAQNNDEILI